MQNLDGKSMNIIEQNIEKLKEIILLVLIVM